MDKLSNVILMYDRCYRLGLSGRKSDTGKPYIDRLGDRVGTASTLQGVREFSS